MEKDIYEILVERLDRAGFVFSSDYQVEKNESMLIAGRYALCNKNSRSSIKHKSKIASKLEISSEELDMMLAIVKEEGDEVTITSIALKYSCGLFHVWSVCSGLVGKGYLYDIAPTDTKEGSYKVTNMGLISLLFEQPIDKLLDTKPYIRLKSEETVFPNDRTTAVERCENTSSSSDAISDFLESELETWQNSQTKNVDVPFLKLLDEKMDAFCDGYLTIHDLLEQTDRSLECSQNKKFRVAFNSVGYEKFSNEQKSFFLMLCNHFAKNGSVPMNLRSKSSLKKVSPSIFKDLTLAANALVTAGIVVIPPDDTNTNNKDEVIKDRFILSPDTAGTIFHGMTGLINYATLCRQAEVWKSDSIEEKTLLFDKEMEDQVTCLKTLMDPKFSAVLMDRLKQVGRKSLTALFYGAPGVGKTELARQLARSTGRDCIVADPAKLNGSYWGDSEKNVREIFTTYKYIQKISDTAPILVFNEADGIITKRFTNVSRAIEKSENTVQGIILQELESFEGIFIGTTNLQENLDVASDRRFLYKVRFNYPSLEIRKKMISIKMKWISDDDAASLANEFCLSGGQLDNIAAKCVIEKFMTGGEATFEKIRSFCREEISIRNPELRQESTIGFIRYPQNASK